jgi:hypothetical protein
MNLYGDAPSADMREAQFKIVQLAFAIDERQVKLQVGLRKPLKEWLLR